MDVGPFVGVSVVGGIVLVVALLAATAIGLTLQRRTGRVRRTPSTDQNGWVLAGVTRESADRVLLLQLSSPVCAPCRQTRALLETMTDEHADVRHVEIDVAERPDVARALNVLRTPTTVAFDRDGTELLRIGGVPRRDELVSALMEETR